VVSNRSSGSCGWIDEGHIRACQSFRFCGCTPKSVMMIVLSSWVRLVHFLMGSVTRDPPTRPIRRRRGRYGVCAGSLLHAPHCGRKQNEQILRDPSLMRFILSSMSCRRSRSAGAVWSTLQPRGVRIGSSEIGVRA